MVHIRPATSADISAIADLQAAAFADDELFNWLYPRRKDYPWTFRHDWLHRLRRRTNEPGQKVFVAESGGDVVGVAIWDWRGKKADEAGWTEDDFTKKFERFLLSIESSYFHLINPVLNKAALKRFRQVGEWKFYNQLADGGFLHLQSLAVDPKHQGQGIGKALIQWGQKFAVDHRLPVTLEASVTGRIVYAKLGFMVIEKEMVSESFEGIAMLWEPPAYRGRWLEYDEDGVHAKVRTVLT